MTSVRSPRSVQRTRAWLRLTLLGTVLGLALLGLLALRPAPRSPGASSPEVAFAQMMIVHHSQAVDLAERLRERLLALKAPDPIQQDLKVLTFDLSSSQLIQMGTFQGWLELWGQPVVYPGTLDLAGMGMARPEEVQALSTLPLAQAETQFLKLMIRHHRGGVAMTKQAAREAQLPPVRALAGRIASVQQGEVRLLEGYLRARGGTPLPAPALPAMPGMHH